MDICQVIRALRESKSISAEQLALNLGVETSTITRVERGERRLSTKLLEEIAFALNTSVTELYAIVEGKVVVTQPHQQGNAGEVEETLMALRRPLSEMNDAQRELLIELAKTVAHSKIGLN